MINMKVFTKNTALTRHEERLTSIFQLLGDSTRYKIFKLLLSKKEFCVSEIAEQVGISVPAASQHFRIFELVGLVDKKRYGQMICYVLKEDDNLVSNLVSFVK